MIPGAKFDLDIIYEAGPEEELQEDIELLAEGFRLLQYDYIGGHGSRGYGKIRFTDLHAEVVVGGMEEALLDELNAILAKV